MMLRGAIWLGLALALTSAATAAGEPDWLAQQMRPLGITALVPGPNGDENAPNHANYDEAKATPYPALPDPLTLKNGIKVADAKSWWNKRRAEIVEDYEREVYGRVPANLRPVKWRVIATDRETLDFAYPVVARRVVGHIENPADPAKSVDINLMEVLPANARGPVPVLVMFSLPASASTFPAPSQPSQAEYDRINEAIKTLLARQDPGLTWVFDAHQALTFVSPPPFRFPQRDAKGDLPPADQLIAAGWGYVALDPTSAQPDSGEGLSSGIIGLASGGRVRAPDQWGALRAWAWAAGRVLDWLETDPRVDAHKVGIEGVSRYGKAALVTMAFDRRFAVGLIGSSGKGGATLLRRNFGEAMGNLGTGESYWFASNFLKYNTKGVSKPNLDASDLPVDSNELIALAAPRPLFISYGVLEQGDAKWLDHKGSFMAVTDAGRVYKLLGASGVGTSGPATMPPPETMIPGELAWRQHTGGHTDAPNFRYFIPWANTELAKAR